MNKKISILLFFVLVLMSISAVSAADADGNNDTIVSSADAGTLALANDVDAIDDLDGNYSDSDGNAVENDAKSVAAGKNNGNDLLSADNDENGNILTAAPKTYYVNASAASGGTGTETAPFQTLNAALNKAENGDTIMIAAGEYKGTDNTGLQIWRNLNFIKYGESEAIFDAEGQSRVWTVMDDSINIIGLTFKNGINREGGAIYMRGGNVTNCTFTGNNATGDSTSAGGAIYCLFYTNVTNCNFTGNTAQYRGGAIYFMRGGNVSDCTFTGNTAKWWGGAIRLETVDNTKGTVTNCAFVNNSAEYGKVISSSGVLESIDNNWWGSNNPDWNELINKGGIPSTYAVLNGSADSETIKPGYNAKLNYTFYMNGTANVLSIPSRPIELSATGGHLDDDTGYLVNGKFSTEFSSDALGEFEITATVDNQEVKLTETVAATVWYVNATAAPGGDGKSQATPFQTLKEALDVAEDYDTIMIAAGTYTGKNNTGLTINHKLTFEKYGEGEAILDAENQWRIWYVNAGTININGLTFKNGKTEWDNGGAIYCNEPLSNSNINATFINNSAENYGGAIFFVGLTNVNITGIFTDNKVDYEDGGAIYFNWNNVEHVIISGEFKNNHAQNGGAIYFDGQLTDVNITGNFTDNIVDGGGGAIYCNEALSNSNIMASFINNTANSFGGAISFSNPTQLTNVNIYGEFINNTATVDSGGAIMFWNMVSDSIIDASFINNKAGDRGAAICFSSTLRNTDITGKFINNTGNSVIHIHAAGPYMSPSGYVYDVIHDSIFINNDASKIINIDSGEVLANDNWFGNNATNYDEAPDVGIDLKDWLFLNATADSTEIGIGENSKITFKLSSYNRNEVSNYNGPIDIKLDLNQTLGELDKTAASLGEEITYTAKNEGDASVTATFETASYTVDLINIKPKTPTSINLTNETMNLKVGDETPAGATLEPNVGNLTYTSSNKSVVIVENGIIRAVGDGTANVTVSFAGDDVYAAAQNKTISVTVSLNEAVWYYILQDVRRELDGASLWLPFGVYNCLVVNSTDQPLPKGLNVTIKLDDDYTLNSTVGDDGIFEVDVNGITPQFYTATFSSYGYTSAVATVLIVKKPTSIALENETMALKVNDNVSSGATLNPAVAGNLTYTSSNSTVAIVENGEIKALAKGTTNITVSFAGDDEYAAAQYKIIEVTVALNDASVTVNDTLDLLVGDEFTLITETVPAGLDVNFTSTDSSVVTVDADGKVTAVGNGTATIVVSVGDDKVYAINTTSVAVTVKIHTEINITNSSVELYVGGMGDITWANLIPTEAGSLKYSSNDTSVMWVSTSGNFQTNSEGTALITVSFAGDENYAAAENKTITVTVIKYPTEIILANATMDLNVNDEVPSGATLEPSWAGELNYTSSNESVVIVRNGMIKAVGEGTANVTVSFAGNYVIADAENKTISVTVSLNDASVSVNNSTLDLFVGDNFTIIATTTPEGLNVTYIPDDSGVVSVDDNGLVTALMEGTASIIVSVGGDGKYVLNSTTVDVTVSKIPTQITAEDIELFVGDDATVGYVLTPSGAEGEVRFMSNDTNVAYVDAETGFVDARGAGVATVSVSFFGNDKYKASNTTITVTVSLNDASVSVENDTAELFVDDTFTINATTNPAGLDVTYVPDNSGVVSVDENGTVTALKEGTANITVKVGGDGVYALNTTNVAVKVSKIPTAITVLNDTFEFKVAEGITYFANLTPVDAGELNYNSSNDDVAIIFAGAIVAVGEGEANVTVSFDGNEKYAAAESKIINVKVTLRDASVSVENDTLDLLVGDLEFINATAVPETLTINYASSNESVVIVDKDGYVLAMGEGSAVITLSVGDGKVFAENSTTVAVSVKKIPTEIEIAAKSIDLIVRENASAGATLLPSEAGNLTYVSSNELVAKVVDGMIVAVGEGNATITVSFAGDYKYATAESKTIDVSVKKTDSSMDIEPKVVELIVGQEATVTVVLPEDATGVVLVDVAGKKYHGDVENGNATVNLVGLTPGNYTADVVYPGDDKYSNANGSVDVKVAELSVAKVNITVPEVKVGEVAKVIVELPKDATGIFVVHVDSKVVAVSSASMGPFELPLGEFSAGNHTIYVSYSGDEKYYEKGVYRMFAVEKLSTDVTAEPVSIYEEETAVVVVSVDVNATGTVLVSVGDNRYYGDVENGNATVEVVGLAAGNYTAAITYLGDDRYANATGSVDIKVAKRIIPDGRISVPEVNVGEVAKLIAELPEDADGKLFVIVDGMSTIYADAPGGTVEIPLGVLSAGNHSAVIIYSGNRIYAESYDSTNFTVVKLSTDVTAEPVEIFKGETAIVVINVDVNATGTVLVDVEGNKYYGVVENGTASVNVTGLAPGNYTADITYIGDDKYGESTGNVSVKVNKLIIPEGGISVPEVNVGEVAKVIAELPEDATGKVAVIVDGKNVTEVPVSGGTVEVPLGVLSAGNHSVAVMYFGNQKYDFCYDFKNFTVAKLSTDVSAEPVDIVVGEIAVVNVAVDVNATGVVFVDIDGNKYCADVFEGNAFVNIEALSVGNYTAVITYQGDDRYAEATGSVDIKVAALMDPKVNVTVPEVKVGEQAKAIVELPENATGNVMAIVEGKGIVIVPVSGGTVEIPLGKLSAGNHSVMVSYSGNDIYDLCYEFVNFTVAKLSTDVSAEPVEIIEGEIAVVNVAVDVNATGVVFVDIDGNKYCADVFEGNAFVNVEALSAGNYTAVITYQGDDRYAEATGSVDIKVAALMDPKVNVTVPAVKVGETAKAIVELPENATGNVAAIVDGKDIAVLLVSGGTVEIPLGELSAGNHTVRVIYSGNDKYIMSGAEKEIAVAKLSTDVSAEPVEIIEGEIAVINVAVDANATGVVFVDIDGNKYCADVFEGNAFVNVEALSAGNYTAVITYQGDEIYAEATGSVAVKVADLVTPDVNITVPALKVGEDAKVIVELPENATGNVIARVDGKDVSALIVSGGTVELPLGELSAGNHTVWVVYSGDGKFAGKAASSEITVDKLTTNISADSAEIKEGEAAIINVTVDAKATGIVLVDIDGNKYYGDVVDGKASVKVVGLTDGTFTANVIYQGDDVYDGATTSSIVSVAPDVRLASQFNVTAGTSIATYAVDFAMHEPGTNYKFRLTDSEGNPIVNATVDFAYKTTYFNRTTDENGCVNLGINTQIAGEYLCALSYLGDDKHNATFVPFNFNIQKKSMTISASAKSYKASASTKKYTVTLKTQKAADGKTYLKAGKKVTMKINGKTYTAKTGSDGKATFNIKLTKKGKFTAAINFAGDATYEAASKKVKITIK